MTNTKQKKDLDKMLSQNQMSLKNMYDIDQDFGKLLDINSSLKYEKCENLNIKIGSKINRIIIFRCKNIHIELNGLISGIEIKHSTDITVTSRVKQPINAMIVENCNDIDVMISKQNHKNTVYAIDKSRNIRFKDHKERQLSKN